MNARRSVERKTRSLRRWKSETSSAPSSTSVVMAAFTMAMTSPVERPWPETSPMATASRDLSRLKTS